MYQHLHPTIDNHAISAMESDTLLADCPFINNIRVTRVDAIDAKGPTWARAIGSMMVEDEEFCMQSDAHMDFLDDWDTGIMSMWASTNNEYAVLSTYVYDSAILPHIESSGGKGINGHHEASILCKLRFDGMHDMPRVHDPKFMVNMPKPKLTNMMFGAGFGFSKCHAERKVPYDPHLAFIFDGEEFSRAIRLWTWGYDIYSPHRVYIVHNYKVAQADPKRATWHFENRESKAVKNEEIKNSVLRLQMLFGMPRNGSLHPEQDLLMQQSRYGLGDRRSLDQAILFSGVDTKRLTTHGDEMCGNLAYVPFVQHPWGHNYIPQYHNYTEMFMDVRDPGSIYFDRHDAVMREAWISADTARIEALRTKLVNHETGFLRTGIRSNPVLMQYFCTLAIVFLILFMATLIIPCLGSGISCLCLGWTISQEMINYRYEIETKSSIKVV